MQGGQREAADRLFALVYPELRHLAAHYLRSERPDHTLQATALVHEAYLKLADQGTPWQNRAHFFGVASQIMRHILVDHARARRANKRGSGAVKVALDEVVSLSIAQTDQVLEVDEALTRLAKIDARQARIVEMRYFSGLSNEEVAAVLGVATRTVNRDWRMAQAWLRRELGGA
jgi:RNA polymerase sigma factor (TIGR02999 family)